VKHARAWLVAWIVLWWLWLLLAGEWNHDEWIAAAAAATAGATLGEIARTRAGARARLPLKHLASLWMVPVAVVLDFGLLMWALVRRQAGTFRAREFAAGGDDPTSTGIRAWTALVATYSPNAYVVEIDPEQQLVLLHDLVPYRRSEEPA
jgi:hypothetical protein